MRNEGQSHYFSCTEIGNESAIRTFQVLSAEPQIAVLRGFCENSGGEINESLVYVGPGGGSVSAAIGSNRRHCRRRHEWNAFDRRAGIGVGRIGGENSSGGDRWRRNLQL